MVKVVSGRTVAAVTSLIFVWLLAGCQQPQTPNEKQARLLAAENLQLKQKLAVQQRELQLLQKAAGLKTQQQEQELAKCRAREEQLQQDLDKGIAERAGDVTAKVIDENAKLRQEVERLRAQLKKSKVEPNQP